MSCIRLSRWRSGSRLRERSSADGSWRRPTRQLTCRLASMIETRPATIEDAEPISALLTANSPDRGGALHGDWPIGLVTEWIESGALIVVAMDGPKLVGALLTSKRAQATAPPVVAMLKAWPGSAHA